MSGRSEKLSSDSSIRGFDRCAVCGGGGLSPFLDLPSVPVNCSALALSAEAARAMPVGPYRLAFCPSCGFVQNTAFDPDLLAYDDGYDNSLSFSPTFRAYQERLVEDLASRWGLAHGGVVEIGCGDAEFLTLLCARTGSWGVGYDPSFSGGIDPDGPIRVHARYFDESCELAGADLICSRHVLEHLTSPTGLARSLRAAMGPDSALYVEVPNAAHVFGSDDIWDLVYQHFGYFSAASLRRVFTDAGLAVDEVAESFGEQFLSLYGSGGPPRVPPADPPAEDVQGSALAAAVAGFADRLSRRAASWATRLDAWRGDGRTSALWGAGSRGVTFLNVVDGAASIDLVVDSNPRKVGRHVPGTGQQVVGPGDPAVTSVDRVVVMNPIYAAEITERLRTMGSTAEVVVV